MLGINHSKLAGAHWLWDIDLWQEAPGLEPNDIGAFDDVDNRFANLDLRWRETQPARREFVASPSQALIQSQPVIRCTRPSPSDRYNCPWLSNC